MSTAVEHVLGKSEFVQKILFEDEYANAARINELWVNDGREGSISVSLVNKIRSDMGLTGNLRGRPRQTAKQPSTGKKRGRPRKVVAAASGESQSQPAVYRGRYARQNRLVDIEADIDRLLFKVMGVDGLADVENALRLARRTVSRAIS